METLHNDTRLEEPYEARYVFEESLFFCYLSILSAQCLKLHVMFLCHILLQMQYYFPIVNVQNDNHRGHRIWGEIGS